jgi:hypothetical protein
MPPKLLWTFLNNVQLEKEKIILVCQHPKTDKNYDAEYSADDCGVMKIDITAGY